MHVRVIGFFIPNKAEFYDLLDDGFDQVEKTKLDN